METDIITPITSYSPVPRAENTYTKNKYLHIFFDKTLIIQFKYLPWVSSANSLLGSGPSNIFECWMAFINNRKYSLEGPHSSTAPSDTPSASTKTMSNLEAGSNLRRLKAWMLPFKMSLQTLIWLLIGQLEKSTLLTSFVKWSAN